MGGLMAGAACVDITPPTSQFLYGYPHVKRDSTGVHDPLFASALYLSDGAVELLFVANDVIFVAKELVARARARIAERCGVPGGNILVSATHTHSGPITVSYISNEADPVVPKPDPAYVQQLEDGIVEAACRARAAARSAEAGFVVAHCTGLGTNRRDPSGPADPQVPVLVVREAGSSKVIGAMLVCSMHPTVLHEDSTLISGDFPGLARQYFRANVFGDCPVLYHTGPAGNQSPRHVVHANTFEEAARLGLVLGRSVENAVRDISYAANLALDSRRKQVDLPRRQFGRPEDALRRFEQAKARLEQLRRSGAPRAEVRTAECDYFGAEETLTLSRAAVSGRLDAAAATCLPAEVQALQVGPSWFVGWPGECFVEFALELKARVPGAHIISLANGELQGYLVTEEAVREGGYESSNALFESPASPQRLLSATLELLERA